MTYQTIELECKDRVATVSLNRPHLRNAFDELVIAELTQAFHQLGTDDEVRVIVLAANGPAFCAGADLTWMQKMAAYSPEENRADAARLAEMLRTIYACPKPVIAKVQGDCYAGGMGLVAACDIAIASGSAHFCLSEVKIGLIPATIGPYVVKAMGERAAHRYFLTAERFSAYEAKQIGFVHETVLPDALDAKVKEIVNAVLLVSPHAVKEAKRLVCDVAGAPLTLSLIADTVERIAGIRASDEGKEGVEAFLQKRLPSWLNE
ncbi:MAG: enoyl-CoA hydratase/isomerase family protein [Burkholderiales bacterium]|nr:enoyl-CoA hydratase/isomerase family protein [Burkholderiales bacterium]